MENLRDFGTEIQAVVPKTFATYLPLLKKNAEKIKSVKKTTFPYGPTPRQELDVYRTPQPSIVNGRTPVLIWLYGGGFVRGEKQMDIAGGLVHANLASFFALRLGYTVVVPDYRLVGQHDDAKFPSGGEDIALTVQWILSHRDEVADGPIDLFAMGNSAGGAHLSTFLFHTSFEDVRKAVFSGTDCRLRGIVFLSAPFDFTGLQAYRGEALEKYYGDGEILSPVQLLEKARKSESFELLISNCRFLILNAELDPDDEIQDGRHKFIKEWLLIDGFAGLNALAIDTIIGHNHISPSCALGTGIDHEEAWGFQVGTFFDTMRKFSPR